jgi:hypothetical protein
VISRPRSAPVVIDLLACSVTPDDCIQVSETSPLEPGEESIKFYCPHVGLIADDDLVLHAVYDPHHPRAERN